MLHMLFVFYLKNKILDVFWNHTDNEPEEAKEVANVKNDDGQLYNLENFSKHDLDSDMHNICIYILRLCGIVSYNPVNSVFRELLVNGHELSNI